jgi:hypothetical protein
VSAALIAGVVVETVPYRAGFVAELLRKIPELTVHGTDGCRRIAAVFSGRDAAELERLGERLLTEEPYVLGVFPTFVGVDDEAAAPPA